VLLRGNFTNITIEIGCHKATLPSSTNYKSFHSIFSYINNIHVRIPWYRESELTFRRRECTSRKDSSLDKLLIVKEIISPGSLSMIQAPELQPRGNS